MLYEPIFQYPYFLDDHTLLLPMLESYLRIDLHRTHRGAADADALQLYDAHLRKQARERREAERRQREAELRAKRDAEKRQKAEARREAAARARDAFVGTGLVLKGKVKRWTHSYGFLKVSSPMDARPLGDVFVHISGFVDRGKPCPRQQTFSC